MNTCRVAKKRHNRQGSFLIFSRPLGGLPCHFPSYGGLEQFLLPCNHSGGGGPIYALSYCGYSYKLHTLYHGRVDPSSPTGGYCGGEGAGDPAAMSNPIRLGCVRLAVNVETQCRRVPPPNPW